MGIGCPPIIGRNFCRRSGRVGKFTTCNTLTSNTCRKYFIPILLPFHLKNLRETADIYFEERFRQIVEEGNENDTPPKTFDGNNAKLTRFRKILGYAAAVIGISATGWLVYQISQPNLTRENKSAKASEVISKPGARTKLLLPDGTEVWLNSGSKLNYKKDFNTHFREVELEGEAFFDVVKDAAHPFIVHTSGIDVKVLGTVFNVKSYPQDENNRSYSASGRN